MTKNCLTPTICNMHLLRNWKKKQTTTACNYRRKIPVVNGTNSHTGRERRNQYEKTNNRRCGCCGDIVSGFPTGCLWFLSVVCSEICSLYNTADVGGFEDLPEGSGLHRPFQTFRCPTDTAVISLEGTSNRALTECFRMIRTSTSEQERRQQQQ